MNRQLNLIIPMAGYGDRFRRAGYPVYKPFIPINNKLMIDYVIEPFPYEIKKYFILNPELLTYGQIEHLKSKTNSTVIEIEGHKNGPVYSISQALDRLPLNESFFIAYSDIYWTWDYSSVEKLLDYDGIVFTRRKFHPHLINSNFSCFCMPYENDKYLLKEIREKGSYTDNWMSEPLSVGTYYYKSGSDMAKAIESDIKNNNRVCNEFFPSVLYNNLLKNNKKILLSDVNFFIHFGVPAQLEDFNHWQNVIKWINSGPKTIDKKNKNICCMGGIGARLQELSNTPKALLEIEGKSMFEFVIDQFFCADNIIITVDKIAKTLKTKNRVINIGEQTKSQLDTLKKSYKFIKNENNFFMTSVDAFGIFDRDYFGKLIESASPDAIVFTFKPTLLQNNMPGHHTYVSIQNDTVINVHIKSKSSDNDEGLAGFFWFKKGSIFSELEHIPEDVKNEMCIDHFIKYLVDTGKKVSYVKLDEYIHLGTKEEYLEYKFWNSFRDILLKQG